MKTMAQWNESGKNLGEFLNVEDAVDETMADYFLGVLPPVVFNSQIIQIGEPSDHRGPNGSARYSTIQKENGQWIYKGRQPRGGR